MNPTLLALGLTATAATQFRVGGLPVGPGEVLLLAWLFLSVTQAMLRPAIPLNTAAWQVGAFWLVLFLALSAGTIASFLIEPFHDYAGAVRDTIAYALMFGLSVMMAIGFESRRERQALFWRMLAIGSALIALQIGSGMGLLPIPGIEPWYWDRLRGWAENPNQLGFFALVVSLLGLHLADSADTNKASLLAVGLVIPPLAAGFMSHSDSFTIGMFLSGALFMTLKSVSWLRNPNLAPTVRGIAVVLAFLCLPLAIFAALPFMSAAIQNIEQSTEQVYGENEQGDLRIHLWQESIEKGISSNLLGFGPGPHLTSKSYKRPPPNKFEAHNTVLDLFTQGGLVAVAAFAWLSWTSFAGTARAGRPALAGLVAGLLVFSMFHYTVRHPIFWFSIVVCLLEAARPARSGIGIAPRPERLPQTH